MFLYHGGKTATATEEQLTAHELAWDEWMGFLEEKEVLIDGLPMEDAGVIVTSDGLQEADFGTDQGTTGYLIIECNDLEEALEYASDCPIFEFGGTVEVRSLINDR